MKELFNNYIQSMETYVMFRIKAVLAEMKDELCKKNREPISLLMGAPTANPPQYVINKLKENANIDGIHSYSTPKGEKFYLEAVSKRMKKRFDVDVNTDEICSLIGSKEGLANTIRALINPTFDENEQEIIMIPDPGYASYSQMIKLAGGRSYSMPLTQENNFMPDLDSIWDRMEKEGYRHDKVKALIINYPNNPLGATCSFEYLKNVVEFCKKHNILLISDAAYVDMYFTEDVPHSILEVEGAKDIATEFYSFSKPYAMTGWRLGWVCGNKEAVEIVAKTKSIIDSGIFKVLQKSAAEVLLSDEGDEYSKLANQNFKNNQEVFLKGLEELNYPMDKINIPSATFYLWLPIPKKYKKSEDFVMDLMKISGVVVVPGNAFGKYGEGFYRVSIVCSENKLKQAIERMKKDGFYYE